MTVALPALTMRPAHRTKVDVAMIERVARECGVSPFRQLAELTRLASRERGLGVYEYHRCEVYRPDLSWDEKRAFVGNTGSTRLNLRLAPPGLTQMRGFISDKLLFTGFAAQMGLPTTRTQAAFATARYLGSLKTLRSTEDIWNFLANEASFPLFGKPAKLRQGQGAVWIDSVDVASDKARLGNGREVLLSQLVAEITQHGVNGYLFQDVVRQHPDLSAITGNQVLATLRIVTVVAQDDRPKVLYAIWRLPPPKAMVDDTWQDDSLVSLVDPSSGRLATLRRGKGPDTEWLTQHPLTQEQVVGRVMPFWPEAATLALAAHGTMPINGSLAWDVGIGPDGPVLVECNENTAHLVYQLASGRGVLNPEFRPIFAEVLARNTSLGTGAN